MTTGKTKKQMMTTDFTADAVPQASNAFERAALNAALTQYINLEPYADRENTLFARPYFTEAKTALSNLFDKMAVPKKERRVVIEAFKQSQPVFASIH